MNREEIIANKPNLRGAVLRSANLSSANLSSADLYGAVLRSANLYDADLRDADLRGADLSGANLRDADLRGANLRGAVLRSADLRDADLSGAVLRSANLRGAVLSGADLRGANLSGANLSGARLPHFQLPAGALHVWGKKAGVLVELVIPVEAKRTACLINRKCRAEFADVVAVHNPDGRVEVRNEWGVTVYEAGEFVYPHEYNDDIRIDCAPGIHFWLTKEEAEEW